MKLFQLLPNNIYIIEVGCDSCYSLIRLRTR